jgi:ArsR family transcriptional regulator
MSKTASRILPADEDRACCTPSAKEASQLAATMDEARASALVARLKALADPTRLRMLELLARHDAPICVCEITPQFALHQPTISHHLRLLREAGLVDCERRGVWAYYWTTETGKRSLASLAGLG